ncbi:MAG TPA: hypothetical protein VGI74_09430 [Streptosporangiaceae bacterium]
MLKRIGAIITAGGAAAALTVALGTAPSFATTTRATWTITPGGAVTGTASNPTLKDTKSGTVLTCKTSTTSATLKKGKGQSNPLGSITKIAFQTCTGPLGLVFTVTIKALPYKLNGNSFSSGVTKGTITGIMASISGSGCSANIAGTTATAKGQVNGTYTNSTGVLKASGGNLHIFGVNGCFGLIANGDPSTFTASYKITPKQTITSP